MSQEEECASPLACLNVNHEVSELGKGLMMLHVHISMNQEEICYMFRHDAKRIFAFIKTRVVDKSWSAKQGQGKAK
jgi:hypothetical protein